MASSSSPRMNHTQLSLDPVGVCGVCLVNPPDYDCLRCDSCACDWHMRCLRPPLTSVPEGDWSCPDCSGDDIVAPQPAATSSGGNELMKKVMEIEKDGKLTPLEKARKRQALLSNGVVPDVREDGDDQHLLCLHCMNRLNRPVTTPCGHNYCLPCLQKSFGVKDPKCSKCRRKFTRKFMEQPRINQTLVAALRMSKLAARGFSTPSSTSRAINDRDRPDTAFVSERAVKSGRANASCGKMMVKLPTPYFGPITAEYTERGEGIMVGETWKDRLDCRQFGAHLSHVAGIYGRSEHGAQSVALSGGYVDDEDHGEWFFYTGSGGRDLSGNKRTNKTQSFDQVFKKSNNALQKSCLNGYPVRVVRSHKEKRSAYAPQQGVRYDGVYRIEKCWRKAGAQNFLVCRYLFVRCDNEPAPWTSDGLGDRPRPLPDIKNQLAGATNITVRTKTAAWDWKEEEGVWGWTRPPHPFEFKTSETATRKKRSQLSKLERDYNQSCKCRLCKGELKLPVTGPCGHSHCKECLLDSFAGEKFRNRGGGVRRLRAQKVIKPCPGCQADLTECMEDPAVNLELVEVIQKLSSQMQECRNQMDETANHEASEDEGEDEVEDEVEDEDEGEEGGAEEEEDKVEATTVENAEPRSNSAEKSEIKHNAQECPAASSKRYKLRQSPLASPDMSSPSAKVESVVAESPFKSESKRRPKRKRGEQMFILEEDGNVEVVKEVVTEMQAEVDKKVPAARGLKRTKVATAETSKAQASQGRKGKEPVKGVEEVEAEQDSETEVDVRKRTTRERKKRQVEDDVDKKKAAATRGRKAEEPVVELDTESELETEVETRMPVTRGRKKKQVEDDLEKEPVRRGRRNAKEQLIETVEEPVRRRGRSKGSLSVEMEEDKTGDVQRWYPTRSKFRRCPGARSSGEPEVIVLDDED